MIQIIIKPLVFIMNGCYKLCGNYGLAIILFTLVSKVILLPLSIWLQKNSIKMVKMQPDLNYIKAKYYGDKERIAEEQSIIYKKYKYNPFSSLIPTFIQLLLLMGVIEVIKVGMNNPEINMFFAGISLAAIPYKVGGWYLLSPVLAALSAFIMCVCQNKSNVIQAEQATWSQVTMLVISVGLSLYLGFFVSVGVALYWVFSNVFAIAQLYLLNFFINPKKYVDYEELEKSKKTLAELEALDVAKKNNPEYRLEQKKEKEDYNRFNSVVNKHLVFYSESSGFYKYYAGIIQYILEKTNLTIHYVTSDYHDKIFEHPDINNRIRAYYIGEKKLITLMMKMDADVVVMTMPDLDVYHIKKSYVRKDIEYVYVPHGMDSLNMTMREHSMDAYSSVLCVGKSQKAEIVAIEEEYGLPHKTIIECGYPLLDDMLDSYREMDKTTFSSDKKMILIAPSWQPDNIVDSCLESLLDILCRTNYQIVVRPHPQHVRHKIEQMEKLKEKYKNDENIEIQLDFSDSTTVWRADLLITDWSGIAYEYFCCTKRPVLFINTPMKVMNPEYQRIDVVPSNIEIRNVVGKSVELNEIESIPEIMEDMLKNLDDYERIISDYLEENIYCIGNSAPVAGKYIVNTILEKRKKS